MAAEDAALPTEFPARLGRTARRALAAHGFSRYEQLTAVTSAELLRIHGVGPKAIRILEEELAVNGQASGGHDRGAFDRIHRRADAPSMSRRRPTALRAAAITVLLVACQAAPAPSALTDPREILAAAAATTVAAHSARLDLTADGTVSLDLLGLGAPSPVELTGTTVSADLNIDGGDARATFSAPGLLGLTGEVIATDGTLYYKTTLTGALYHQVDLGADVPQPSSEARASILTGITDFLNDPTLRPVKGDDAPCGSGTCYRVDIELTPADLAALGAGALQAPTGLPIPVPIPDLSAAAADLTVLVAKDTTRLMGVKAIIDLGGGAGVATLDLTLSKWDEATSIVPPPADQLAPAN